MTDNYKWLCYLLIDSFFPTVWYLVSPKNKLFQLPQKRCIYLVNFHNNLITIYVKNLYNVLLFVLYKFIPTKTTKNNILLFFKFCNLNSNPYHSTNIWYHVSENLCKITTFVICQKIWNIFDEINWVVISW